MNDPILINVPDIAKTEVAGTEGRKFYFIMSHRKIFPNPADIVGYFVGEISFHYVGEHTVQEEKWIKWKIFNETGVHIPNRFQIFDLPPDCHVPPAPEDAREVISRLVDEALQKIRCSLTNSTSTSVTAQPVDVPNHQLNFDDVLVWKNSLYNVHDYYIQQSWRYNIQQEPLRIIEQFPDHMANCQMQMQLHP